MLAGTLRRTQAAELLSRGSRTIRRYIQRFLSRGPEEYIRRGVWTRLKGEVLFIESGKRVIAQYQLKHDRLDRPLEADNLDLD